MMEQLLERSLKLGAVNSRPIQNKQLFRNSRPTPSDTARIRIKQRNENSKSAKRKAYDKLRKAEKDDISGGDVYRRSEVGRQVTTCLNQE